MGVCRGLYKSQEIQASKQARHGCGGPLYIVQTTLYTMYLVHWWLIKALHASWTLPSWHMTPFILTLAQLRPNHMPCLLNINKNNFIVWQKSLYWKKKQYIDKKTTTWYYKYIYKTNYKYIKILILIFLINNWDYLLPSYRRWQNLFTLNI